MRKKIGECLIQAGLITEDDLRTALAEHKRTGERVGVVLVRMNLATEEQIAKALAFQLGFPFLNLAENPPDPNAVALIPKEVALKRICIGVGLEKNLLTVAMSDPLLLSLVHDLELQTGHRIKQAVSTRADINGAIHACYPDKAPIPATPEDHAGERASNRGGAQTTSGEAALEPVAGLKARSEAAPIVDLVDLVIKGAIKSKASDVHVEPMEEGVLVRHRLDGLLKQAMDLPKWVHEGLVARLKIMAGMDIAETRLPQDGRLRSAAEDGTEVDFRVSTLRTLFGAGDERTANLKLPAAGTPFELYPSDGGGAAPTANSPLDTHTGPAPASAWARTAVFGPRRDSRMPPPSIRDDSRRRTNRQREDHYSQRGAEVGAVGEDQHRHD